MAHKTILLAAFAFPPYKSIGSRRWAKFAKYLAQKGYRLFVIASENPYQEAGNWLNDIIHENIQIYYLPYTYPKILKNNSSSFRNRLIRKAILAAIQIVCKGNLSDEAIFWKHAFLKKAEELIIKHKVNVVISTSPPFRLSFYTCLLKKKFPQLKVISDFRDVWSDGRVFGKEKFKKSVEQFENRMEDYVFRESDFLTFTDSQIITNTIKKNPKIDVSKFVLLPHAFDIDDYNSIQLKKEQKKGNTIVFVFGGTLTSPCIEEVAVPLWNSLVKMKKEMPEIYYRLKFIFYHTNILFNKRLKAFPLDDIFEVRQPITEEAFFQTLAQADYPVSILSDFLKDYITTKNISYLPFKKPIVLIANTGRATQMIEENNLGYVLTPKDCYNTLLKIVDDHDLGVNKFNQSYDIESHSFEKVTDIIEKLL